MSAINTLLAKGEEVTYQVETAHQIVERPVQQIENFHTFAGAVLVLIENQTKIDVTDPSLYKENNVGENLAGSNVVAELEEIGNKWNMRADRFPIIQTNQEPSTIGQDGSVTFGKITNEQIGTKFLLIIEGTKTPEELAEPSTKHTTIVEISIYDDESIPVDGKVSFSTNDEMELIIQTNLREDNVYTNLSEDLVDTTQGKVIENMINHIPSDMTPRQQRKQNAITALI